MFERLGSWPPPRPFQQSVQGRTHSLAPVAQAVLEHTGIEPFSGHIHLTAQGQAHIEPIIAAVTGRLPTNDHYELQPPVGALRNLRGKGLHAVQGALADFVVATAPSLRLAPPGRYLTPVTKQAVPGAPFSIALHRLERWAKQPPFSVTHVVDSTLESQREDRLREACARKFAKLAGWRAKANARTVLVLEQNDIFASR